MWICIILIKLNKRGPVIIIIGLVFVISSLVIISSILPPNTAQNEELYIPTLFKGMFSQTSNDIQILPGTSEYYSYNTKSSNVSILWGVQIIDYQDGDNLSVTISNIFGDKYGVFTQITPIVFETLEISKSDTLNFEIQNHGSRTVNVVLMLSEDPKNSDAFSNPNSPMMTMILPMAISGIVFVLGIIVFLIGIILSLVDWKKIQNNKRNY